MRKVENTVVEKKAAKGLSKVKKAVVAACGAGYMGDECHAYDSICGTGGYSGNHTAS